MADVVSKDKRSRMMAGIKGKNTKPEILIRKALYKRGYRYRLHVKGIPGKPDMVLRKHNALIFVNGCFWHGHENCRLFRIPKSRVEFWKEKIGGNIARDKKKTEALLKEGWRVLVIWECALKGRKELIPATLELTENWLVSKKSVLAEIRADQTTGKPVMKP